MKKSLKKRRTSKIMKGGRFLGEGSYGCVISPALSCKVSTKKNSRYTHKTHVHSKYHKNHDNKRVYSNSNSNDNNDNNDNNTKKR